MRLNKLVTSARRRIPLRFRRFSTTEASDEFSLHESLIAKSYGPASPGFSRSVLGETLNLQIKNLLNVLAPVKLSSRMSEVDSCHFLLSELSSDEIRSFAHSYLAWELPYKHPITIALQNWITDAFADYFNSPISIVNSRAWRTTARLESGPFKWHTDGFKPGHAKIMIYPDGLSEKLGGLEIEDSRIHSAEPGTAVAFQNSAHQHRAIPPRDGGARLAIEITIQRTLCTQHQRFPSHFNGRHLKSARYFYGSSKVIS